MQKCKKAEMQRCQKPQKCKNAEIQKCKNAKMQKYKRATIQKYEIVSDRITRIQKHAERACGKVPYGRVWSPELKQAGLSYLLWKGLVTHLRRHLQLPRSIYDKNVSLNESVPITRDIIQAVKTMRERKEELRTIQI
jgi:hypothetical protein